MTSTKADATRTVHPPQRHRRTTILQIAAFALFPLLIALFALIYVRDATRYLDLFREDGPVEWLTFASIFLAGLIALDIAIQIWQRHNTFHWFFLIFGLFCLAMALEEISWGQRLFAISSPEYFLSNSDQQEINVHNVLQVELGFKTKDVAGIALFLYGFALPWLTINRWLAAWLQRLRIVVPPRYLSLGFLFSTLLMLDIPTGFEEEIGEMAFGFCFLLFMIHELLGLSRDHEIRPFDLPKILSFPWVASFERAVLIGLTLVAVALRIWRLDGQGLWLREASYWAVAQVPQAGIIQLRQVLPPHWPGWLFGQAIWLHLAGASEFTLRYLAAMAGVVAVPLLWQLLQSTWPYQVLLRNIATLLLAMSPAAVAYSQELSEHAFALVLTLLSLQMTINMVRRPSWWISLGWLVVNGLLVAFTPVAALLVLAEVITYGSVVMRGNRVGLRYWVLPVVGALLALFVLRMWVGESAPGATTFLGPGQNIDEDGNTLAERLNLAWLQLNFAHILFASGAARLAIPLLPLLFCGLYRLFIHRPNQLDHPAPFNVDWLLAGILVITAIFVGMTSPHQPIMPTVYALPAVVILLALGILLLWQSVRLVGLFALFLSFGVCVAVLTIYLNGADAGYRKSDYRAMATNLQARATDDDDILLLSPQQIPLATHYLAEIAPLHSVPPVENGDLGLLTAPMIVPEQVEQDLRASVEQHPTTWLVLFEDGPIDPGNFVVNFLTAISYKSDCTAWFDVGLCRFINPTFYPPQVQTSRDALFSQKLLLEATGIALEQSSKTLLFELDWHALDRLEVDYKYSVRLIGADGTVRMQRDEFLVGPLLPPTTWSAGDQKRGYMALPIPDQSPGDYAVELIVYDPSTLLAVPLTLAGAELGEQPLSLANVQISADGTIALLN